jgi:RNA polymerase sigma factor (TIGR02999 family)
VGPAILPAAALQADFKDELRHAHAKISYWYPMASGEPDAAASITSWLVRWREGDDAALAHLTSLVYAELRRLAATFLQSEREGHTLQPTALVHELYMQLTGVRSIDWKCRAQFWSIAARMMRNILVDHARMRSAGKRGGGQIVQLDEYTPEASAAPDLVLVDAALSRFAKQYPRQAQVVELRFFGGLTSEETVEAMNVGGHDVSLRTVERDWRFSKTWLQNELGSI